MNYKIYIKLRQDTSKSFKQCDMGGDVNALGLL